MEREEASDRVERLGEGAPDRAELAERLMKLVDSDDNRAFDPSELAEIRIEIEALHAQVEDLTNLAKLNLEQQKVLGRSLDKIQSGSERLGRKDWLTYAIGVGTTLVIAEVVPPLVLLRLAVHAIHAVGHLLIPAAEASP